MRTTEEKRKFRIACLIDITVIIIMAIACMTLTFSGLFPAANGVAGIGIIYITISIVFRR